VHDEHVVLLGIFVVVGDLALSESTNARKNENERVPQC
jgi:hypothetical protein